MINSERLRLRELLRDPPPPRTVPDTARTTEADRGQ